jgi:hypothetical protein
MIFHSIFKYILFRFNVYARVFKAIIVLFEGTSNMVWIQYDVDK